jgi:hypothetical protein
MSLLAAQQRTSSVRLVVGKEQLTKRKSRQNQAWQGSCHPELPTCTQLTMRHALMHRVKICVFDGCAQFWLIGQDRRISLGLDWLEPMLAVRNF